MTSEAKDRIDGTKKRLLEAMEDLVMERGFDAVSIRDITGMAKANVAAVNYHFGSREGLVQAVVEQRLRPLVLLRQEELMAATKTNEIDHLLRMWLLPILTIQQALKEDESRYCRVMGRCLEMAHALPSASCVQELRIVDNAYLEQMLRILPSGEIATASWRFHACRGSLIYALVYGHQMMPAFSLQAHINLLQEMVISSLATGVSTTQMAIAEPLPMSPPAPIIPAPALIPDDQEEVTTPSDDGYGGKFLF